MQKNLYILNYLWTISLFILALWSRNIFYAESSFGLFKRIFSFFFSFTLTRLCTSSPQLLLCRRIRIKFARFFCSLLVMDREDRGLHYASHSLLQTGNSYKSPEESPHTEHGRLRWVKTNRVPAPLRERNKAEEINATPPRLLPRETGTRIKICEPDSAKAMVDSSVMMIKISSEKTTLLFKLQNRAICRDTYLQNVHGNWWLIHNYLEQLGESWWVGNNYNKFPASLL